MKIAVEFPSVMYREGPESVAQIATAIDEIGFDQLDIFDHVVMGHPMDDRNESPYPAKMPILEALMALSFFASCTKRVGLGTEVLVLPQRQPTLTAKQVSTLDTLSGGRVRLGVGVGWQASEYDSLGREFKNRGKLMDEAIVYLRQCWSEDPIDFEGADFNSLSIAMEPKPPQGKDLPIWIGGESDAAIQRTGTLGNGWMAVRAAADLDKAAATIARIREIATEAGRDPDALGFQCQLAPPPQPGSDAVKDLYSNPQEVAESAARLQEAGFGWAAVNGTGLFVAGKRSAAAMIDGFAELHDAIRKEVG